MFLDEWGDKYFAHLLMMNRSENTIEGYRGVLGVFFWYVKKVGVEDFLHVTREILSGYQDFIKKRRRKRDGEPISLQTVLWHVMAVKGFLKYLHEEEKLEEDLSLFLEMKRIERRLPAPVLSEEEVSRLIQVTEDGTLKGRRDRMLIEFFYGTGLRRNEGTMLEVDDIDLEERLVYVRNGKGKRDRIVPMGPVLSGKLKKYLLEVRPEFLVLDKNDRRLFLSERGTVFNPSSLGSLVKSQMRKCGVGGGTHTLRHSFATHLLRNGANLLYIQRLLGHRRLSSTVVYVRVFPKDLREVILAKHPRSFFPTPELRLPVRMSNVKLPYLLKLRAAGKTLDEGIYFSEKLAKKMVS